MQWGALKQLATKTIHRKDIDWNGLQQIAFDELDMRLVVEENEGFAVLSGAVQQSNTLWACPVPSNYARTRSLFRGKRALTPCSMRDMLMLPDNTGVYATSARNIWNASNSDLHLTYSIKAARASNDAQETPMLAFYSNVVLYALLKHGAVQAVDTDKLATYEEQLTGAIELANSSYMDAAFGAGMAPAIPGGHV